MTVYILLAILTASAFVAKGALLATGLSIEDRVRRLEDSLSEVVPLAADRLFHRLVLSPKEKLANPVQSASALQKVTGRQASISPHGKWSWLGTVGTNFCLLIFAVGGIVWVVFGFVVLLVTYIVRELLTVALPPGLEPDPNASQGPQGP